jgi:NADPH:quinone reductase-like Zn-dependent oxidoreductase
VIDYTEADVLQDTERFDAIFDCIGRHRFWSFRRLLRPRGIHVGIAGRRTLVVDSVISSLTPGRTSLQFHVRASGEDLEFLAALASTAALKPIISHDFGLREMADAHRQCETSRTVGKIAVAITHGVA